MLPFSIDHIDGHFHVTFGQHSICISTADVESCLFTVCWMLRQLLTVVDAPFEKAKGVLLNDNPTWGYHPDADILQLLVELPVTVLVDGIHHFQAHKAVRKLRKNELV
jgi:hypothetical protein